MVKNEGYNFRHQYDVWSIKMPKKTNAALVSFGARLVELRKAAGYTQQELADEIGVTRRMIAYYEGETDHTPSSLLPGLAKALGLSIERLLGTEPIKTARKTNNSRLQRRLQAIEKLDTNEKRQILQLIDAFIERGQLKKKVSG